MSTNNNKDVEQKKRSQAIDRKLEEDSKRLRRECKILLLGMFMERHLRELNLTRLINRFG